MEPYQSGQENIDKPITLPLKSKITLPLKSKITLPLKSKITLPLKSKITIPLKSKITLPLKSKITLPPNLETELNDPFYGEINCQKLGCKNGAYYKCKTRKNGLYLCGVHCKGPDRIELFKDPNKKHKQALKLSDDKVEIEKSRQLNRSSSQIGHVICTKLFMSKPPIEVKGYLKIFPNFKHGNRKDGLGMPSLSPMSLGPVNHGQYGLPPARNLENGYQGNKVYPFEVGPDQNPNGQWYKTQLEIYNDPVPHRHKPNLNDKPKSVPLYSVWIDKDHSEKHVSYFESRQFYCNFYERLVKDLPDFQKLIQLRTDGYNLQIVGYDGYNIDRTVDQCYIDMSRPFGHELVLYTMLTHKESDYPWRHYKTYDF
jgi:hypothetical protein